MRHAETIASPEIMHDQPKLAVVFWRHEESARNADRSRIQGFAPQTPLSDLGAERAEQSGAPGLRRFLDQHHLEVVEVYSSEADRARQTAARVLGGAGVQATVRVDGRLNEQNKGHNQRGGVEGLLRAEVETAAYKAREALQGWHFRPGVDDKPGVAESGAETPAETAARWLAWRDDLTTRLEREGVPRTSDPNATPTILVFGHNLITAYGMGAERGMDVPESKRLYRVGNGEGLVLGWDGQSWNLQGQLYRPAVETNEH
jgi:broad specificity phosphatase PhoE